MSIQEITAITDIASEMGMSSIQQAIKTDNSFVELIKTEILQANENINQAEQVVRQLAVGETENLHQVMMALEKAKTSFEFAVQVRNRLLESYQEVMRMQV